MIRTLAAIFSLAASGGSFAGDAPPEPADYRMEAYRAPVPATLAGATVVTPQEARTLWESGTVAFIDVMPQAPKPKNLPEDTIWRQKPRHSIEGAVWLPNTGYGALADVNHAYFRDNLARITGGDTGHPVLFFCLPECWMSWNAAKRALEDGYTSVFWLPEGTEGWAAEGHALQKVEAEPGGQ